METIQHISITISLIMSSLSGMMERPNHPTHFACKVCDKVCVGNHDMVRHFQSSHMSDGKIIYEELNHETYFNYLDRVPNFLRSNLSLGNPNPKATKMTSLASPLLPFIMGNHTFGEKTSVQEVDSIVGVTDSSHDCTKLLIDKLDRPILEGIESNEENAGNGFNSEIDLTLKL